jgi:Protein of unknown function (DUF3575).
MAILSFATISSYSQQANQLKQDQLPELMIPFRLGRSNIDLNRIEGYTSLDGGSVVNDCFSRERAESLSEYFIANYSDYVESEKRIEKYPVRDNLNTERVAGEEIKMQQEVLEWKKKSLFAIKTNLLLDAVSALNVEVEIPLGIRWSVAAEYIFPWWLWEKKQIAFELFNLNIEGRLWLDYRAYEEKLIGWYMGAYAGGGYFDFEWKDKGYQGEFFIATGLSAGYAHPIGKRGNWRMEYGLGVGILHTNYREYVPKFGSDGEWHLIRKNDGQRIWLGPTKAKVSLVWMINGKKRGGAR